MFTGTLQCPGGHLEHGESFATTAAREALEETGLEIGNVKFLTATNDVFGEGKHYVTVFVTGEIVGVEKEAKVCYLCSLVRDFGFALFYQTPALRVLLFSFLAASLKDFSAVCFFSKFSFVSFYYISRLREVLRLRGLLMVVARY
jgi:ADP-ribose pyrophosphatase YjhB (NUDIX family)